MRNFTWPQAAIVISVVVSVATLVFFGKTEVDAAFRAFGTVAGWLLQ